MSKEYKYTNTELQLQIEENLQTGNIITYRCLSDLTNDYSREFRKKIYSKWPNVMNQARSLFTAICMVEDLEADTNMTDLMLSDLYSLIEDVTDYTQEEFENFMLEDIV